MFRPNQRPATHLTSHPTPHLTWSLAGNVVYSASQWLFVVVLAKLGTPEDVGEYALGLALTSPVLLFAAFQGRNLVASDVRDEYSFGEYLSFRLASLSLALVILVGLVLATGPGPSAAAVAILIALGQALDLTSETFFGLMQRHEHLDWVAQSLIVKGPLCLILLTLSMLLTHSLLWSVGFLAVGRLVMLCVFDSVRAARIVGPLRLVWDHTRQKSLFTVALPFGVIAGLGALNLNMPRYFIESTLTRRDLGIFSAVATLIGAGNLIMAAIASCSFTPLARAHADRDAGGYRALSMRLFASGAFLGGAGVLAALTMGDRILTLVFRPEYSGSGGVFARIMLAGGVGYVVSGQGYAMTAARCLIPQIPLTLCAAASTALFAWWLVPLRVLAGAAEAWLLGSLIQLALSTALLTRLEQVPSADRHLPAASTVPADVA